MDPLYLSDEELNYELDLRRCNQPAYATRRIKGVQLRALIQKEFAENVKYTSSEHAMPPDVNIHRCEQQVRLLIPMIETALKKRNTDFLIQSRSRMLHYRNRLSIVKPPLDLIDMHASVSMQVKFLIEDISDRLGDPVISDSSAQVLQPADGAGSLEYQLHHNTLLSPEEEQNQSRTAAAITQTGAIRRQNNEGLHNDFIRATSSPIRSGRGRGRGVAINLSQPGRNSSQPRDTPPPAYHPIGTRMAQDSTTDHLRDELLIQLLQREQHAQDRQETGRGLKAVHNWPFKFKGEKDTTSLNTFLDRVETFARSEGLSDDTLLKSIKHLLLDDALDWYGRAVSQNLLVTWAAFKNEIRKEYLPSSYEQILKLEAIFRFQAPDESFAKYYRDISALFRFVQPPMSEQEKFFIVKKNMNADYATIVTAARPASLQDMVEVCSSYDETRMLLNRQKRVPFPQNSLLEPNLATPVNRPTPLNRGNPRFGRVHALNSEEDFSQLESCSCQPQATASKQPTASDNRKKLQESESTGEKEDWQQRILELTEQVNALKLRQYDRDERPHRNQRIQDQEQPERAPQPGDQRRGGLICWNCDEDGHRFMDCPKPQAVMFCYRCGHKGYSLRNCPTCRAGLGNAVAGNQ